MVCKKGGLEGGVTPPCGQLAKSLILGLGVIFLSIVFNNIGDHKILWSVVVTYIDFTM